MKIKLTNWSQVKRALAGMVLPVLLVAFSIDFSYAQGGCAVNDLVNFAIDADGTSTLTRDMVLEDPGNCNYDCFLRLSWNSGILVENSSPSDHPAGLVGLYREIDLRCFNQRVRMGDQNMTIRYLCGETLTAEIIDVDGVTVLGWGYVKIEDKTPPNVTINDAEVPCTIDKDPASIAAFYSPLNCYGNPCTSDNCGTPQQANISYEDFNIHLNDCHVGYFDRRWTVVDNCGNETVAVQRIVCYDNTPPTIVWPKDVELDCADADTDPDNTGRPEATDDCSFFAYEAIDHTLNQCPGECYKIHRTWKVVDWCNFDPLTGQGVYTDLQVIKVVDEEAPDFDVEDGEYGPTHNTCLVNIVLPAPSNITDNCSTDFSWSVTLHEDANGSCPTVDAADVAAILPSSGGNNGERYNDLECGQYIAVYTVVDCCGNATTKVACITIVDDIPPVAICDNESVLTLTHGTNVATCDNPGNGWATICKESVDDGSYDNCEVKDIKIAKAEFDANGDIIQPDQYSNGRWRDCQTYRCNEKGDNPLFLRVRDEKDNVSYCWMNVKVEDKNPPLCVFTPADADVLCGDDVTEGALGSPIFNDECELTCEVEDTYESNHDGGSNLKCGGIITRTWTATDCFGNTATCQQTITVGLPEWKPNLSTPADVTLDCAGYENDNPGVDVTGEATYTPQDTCNLVGVEGPEDWRLPVVGTNDVKILRKWTFFNWCTGESCEIEQKIVLTDCDASSQPTGSIFGTVTNILDFPVEDATINVNTISTETNQAGNFYMYNIPTGAQTVAPSMTDNPTNGVSTLDVILMRAHILGTQTIDNPFSQLSADVNNSNSITTFDIVQTRQLILGQIDAYPSSNSWKFVDENFEFVSDDAFAEIAPSSVTVDLEEGAEVTANFIGVKVGDVSGNAVSTTQLQPRGTVVLGVNDRDVSFGELVTVDFTANDFANLVGYQFTLEFNKNALDFVNVEAGALPQLSTENFGLDLVENGIITTSWDNISATDLENDAVLFSVTFNANSSASLSELLTVTSGYTSAEAYDADLNLYNVSIEFRNGDNTVNTADQFALFQNRPNPFASSTIVSFNLPEAGDATLTVYDVAGKVLKVIDATYAKGYNEVSISAGELANSGILYYELTSAGHKATKKMIMLR